jgi:hypothetical protein
LFAATERAAAFFKEFSAPTRYQTNPACWSAIQNPSSKPGSHWIVIFIDLKGRGEYFDSFGRKPTTLFENYLNKNCTRWIFNTRQLQSIVSSYCGFYCCFYCMLRCRGFDLTRIVKIFTGDTGFNDSIVRGFVCNDGFDTD